MTEKAVQFFLSKGYIVARVAPAIIFGEDKNKPIFVSLADATKVKFIPPDGFGSSKAGRERARHFVEGIQRWMDSYCFNPSAEYDVLWVGKGCFHHVMDIDRKIILPPLQSK